MKSGWILFSLIIVCILAGGIAGWFIHPKEVPAQTTNTVFIDTGKTLSAALKIIKVQKEVSVMQLDSIYNIALQYWMNKVPYIHDTLKAQFGLFSLSKDTNFTNADSTVKMAAHREVRNRLPFYEAQFYDKYQLTFTPKTIAKDPGSNFGFVRSLTLGPNYDLIHKTFGVSIQIGYGIKF